MQNEKDTCKWVQLFTFTLSKSHLQHMTIEYTVKMKINKFCKLN